MQEQLNSNTPPPPRKGKGCLFYVIISIILFVVLTFIGGIAGFYFLVRSVTDDKPHAITVQNVSPEDGANVKNRIDAFILGLSGKGQPVPLALTEFDLNAILATEDAFKDMRDKVKLHISGDKIGGEVSIPLDEFGYPGRFINGNADFQIFMTHGKVFAYFHSLNLNGFNVPQALMSELAKKNLLEKAFDKPEELELLNKLENIEVRGGLFLINPKQL